MEADNGNRATRIGRTYRHPELVEEPNSKRLDSPKENRNAIVLRLLSLRVLVQSLEDA